jgi:hypothetical protein
MIEFLGPLYHWIKQFKKSLSDNNVIIFRLDTPRELLRLPTELKLNCAELTLLYSFLLFQYSFHRSVRQYLLLLGTVPPESTVFSFQEFVSIDPLPSNRYLSVVERSCCGNMFSQPLPNDGHTCHNNNIFPIRISAFLVIMC